MEAFFQQYSVQFYILIIVAFTLSRIPYIGIFFKCFNTLAHELGHTILALLTKGTAERIDLHADTSGLTHYTTGNKFGQFVVAIAGYPFSMLFAAFAFFCVKYSYDFIFIYALLALIIFTLLLFIRNTYGIIWSIVMITLLVSAIYLDDDFLCKGITVFVGFIFASEGIISTFQLLMMAYKTPKNAGDASDLQKLTHIPALVWGFLFFVFACWMGFVIVWNFFPAL